LPLLTLKFSIALLRASIGQLHVCCMLAAALLPQDQRALLRLSQLHRKSLKISSVLAAQARRWQSRAVIRWRQQWRVSWKIWSCAEDTGTMATNIGTEVQTANEELQRRGSVVNQFGMIIVVRCLLMRRQVALRRHEFARQKEQQREREREKEKAP